MDWSLDRDTPLVKFSCKANPFVHGSRHTSGKDCMQILGLLIYLDRGVRTCRDGSSMFTGKSGKTVYLNLILVNFCVFCIHILCRTFLLCFLRTYLVADISFCVFLRTYLVADISFCVFWGHILWRTFLFVFFEDISCGGHIFCVFFFDISCAGDFFLCFFADISCGGHFFLCFLRTYLVADIFFLCFLRTYLVADISFCVFCGHILWRTYLFVFFEDISYGLC